MNEADLGTAAELDQQILHHERLHQQQGAAISHHSPATFFSQFCTAVTSHTGSLESWDLETRLREFVCQWLLHSLHVLFQKCRWNDFALHCSVSMACMASNSLPGAGPGPWFMLSSCSGINPFLTSHQPSITLSNCQKNICILFCSLYHQTFSQSENYMMCICSDPTSHETTNQMLANQILSCGCINLHLAIGKRCWHTGLRNIVT